MSDGANNKFGYRPFDATLAEAGWERPVYPGANQPWPGSPDDQYLRKWSLSIGKAAAGYIGGAMPGIGDSELITTETQGMDFRMTFKVRHADSMTPGTAEIRIYNLSNETANKYIKERSSVVLSAGYVHGHFGIIFQGAIKQYKKGRESATDSYLDIFAADGDINYNYGFLNFTLPKADPKEFQKKIAEALEKPGGAKIGHLDDTAPPSPKGTIGGIMPNVRGSVGYGLSVDGAKELQRNTGNQFSIQNGEIQSVKSTLYLPGEVIVINSATGMIGSPEETQDGITVTCLLNPGLRVKQQVQLDNKSVNQYFLPGQDASSSAGHAFQSTYGQYGMAPQYYASISNDGKYTVLVIDHEGDTRGLPWYSHLTCLDVDPTNSFGFAVPGGFG